MGVVGGWGGEVGWEGEGCKFPTPHLAEDAEDDRAQDRQHNGLGDDEQQRAEEADTLEHAQLAVLLRFGSGKKSNVLSGPRSTDHGSTERQQRKGSETAAENRQWALVGEGEAGSGEGW